MPYLAVATLTFMGARPVKSLEETKFMTKPESVPEQPPAGGPLEVTGTPPAGRRIRVLVVDDHPLVRHGISLLINRQSDLQCCDCEVSTAAGVIPAVEQHKPDLVLLDLNLKDGSALPVIRPLKVRFPAVIVLVLSQFDEMLCAEEALHAGAAGYVLKEEATQEILAAIRAVLHREIYLSHKMASAFLNQLVGAKAPPLAAGAEHLSRAELEVFQLIGAGLSTYEIAGQMKISARAVETHRKHLRQKLKLPDNTARTEYAVRCRHGFDPNCSDADALLLHCAVQWEQWEQGRTPAEGSKPSAQPKPSK